jgi:phage terminase large subunit GpA-like protein
MSSATASDGLSAEHREWIARQFDALTDDIVVITPSEWAETRRYLPPSSSAIPGYYRYEVTPYLKEIADCFAFDSPIREITLMKGVQIGATVGVFENVIGYCIDHVKTAPVMMLTADAELAKIRVTGHIIPMLQASGLEHLIRSSDEKNPRKTGRTDTKLEWDGGGSLLPFGAQNANKLRSVPIQVLLRDEPDGYPDVVGKDGDPMALSFARTKTYENSRKVGNVSTPTILGRSKIHECFLRGDQRRYFVRCLKCNFAQTLKWRRTNKETGEITGIVWELNNGVLVPDSVHYLCRECAHPHSNSDKVRLLSPEHGAEWIPTAEPKDATHRSYHLSALYSPPGMQTWAACVHDWLAAWDVEHNRSRDNAKLQVFYNNVLGEPFELRGERLRFENVSAHRRPYHFGQVPNKLADQFCGSPILLLTCAVDVHKDNLAVSVVGWCRDRRAWLIDYWRFEGDTERLEDAPTWGRLRELIETKEYVADDGKRYRLQMTLVDSGYRADDVYQFAAEYEFGVYPVKGRDTSLGAVTDKEFSEFTTPMGTTAFGVFVNFYKDRWSPALRRGWDGQSVQPHGHFNAPVDCTDKQLKELTVEVKREKIVKETGKRIGFEWHRPSGADNELWDTLVYNSAALDLIAWNYCVGQRGGEFVNWVDFYEVCLREKLYFTNGMRG